MCGKIKQKACCTWKQIMGLKHSNILFVVFCILSSMALIVPSNGQRPLKSYSLCHIVCFTVLVCLSLSISLQDTRAIGGVKRETLHIIKKRSFNSFIIHVESCKFSLYWKIYSYVTRRFHAICAANSTQTDCQDFRMKCKHRQSGCQQPLVQWISGLPFPIFVWFWYLFRYLFCRKESWMCW